MYNVGWVFEVQDGVSNRCYQMVDANKELDDQCKRTQGAIDSQNISFMTSALAVTGVYRGAMILTRSLHELGLVSGQSYEQMQKLVAVVGLAAGAFRLLGGAQKIILMLRDAEVSLAAVESFRAVLKNPGAIGMVIAGIGIASVATGYILGQHSNTTVNQEVNFYGTGGSADARGVARDTLEAAGG
jgi:hypothetical protein